MESTYGTNIVNNHNNYKEVDNSSETSKDYASSNSSLDDAKKRNSMISFDDDKDKDNPDVREEKSKSRRKSIRKILGNKKDGEEKESALSRTLSFFSKDKDKDKENKRNSTVESEKHLRSTSRTSSNSDASKRHSFIFTDDDDRLEINTTRKEIKSRQYSNPESFEKDSSTKQKNRLSVNLGKIFKGLDENKSSPKAFEDIFLEPDETMVSPKSPRNSFHAGPPSSLISKQKDYVESPRNIHPDDSILGNGTFPRDNTSKNNSTDESQNDDVQSTNSSTRPSSLDDRPYNIGDDEEPTSPTTPRLVITRVKARPEEKEDDDEIDNSSIESKPDEVKRRNIKDSNFNSFQDDAKTEDNATDEQILKKLQELENINKSLNDAKIQLEAKVAERDNQIGEIMKQQVDLSERMTETMHRLSNVQKEELDSSSVGKVFEGTIKRLEDKIDRQNEEICQLKSILGQLSGNLFLRHGDFHQLKVEDQNLIMAHGEESQSLIQTNQSQTCSNTLVNTLVVSPIYMSATIAASVLHAVYVRPVIGFIKIVREISLPPAAN